MAAQPTNPNNNLPTAPPGMPNPGQNNPWSSPYVTLVFDGDHFLYARRGIVALRFGLGACHLADVMVDGVIPVPGLDKREATIFLYWLNTGVFRLMQAVGETDQEKRKCIMIECLSLYGAAMRYDLQDLASHALASFSHYGDQIGVRAVLVMLSDYAFAGEGGDACIIEYVLRRCHIGQVGFLTVPSVFQVRESYGMQHTIASVLLQLGIV